MSEQPSSKDIVARLRYAHTDVINRLGHLLAEDERATVYGDAADEIERLQRANRTRPEYNLRCEDCGRAHILDTSIPSEIWNQIAGDASILCTTCIDDRMVKHGLEGEAKFYFVGKALICALYEGDRDEIKYARLSPEPCAHLEKIELEDSNASWCTECGAFHDGTQWINPRRAVLAPLPRRRPTLEESSAWNSAEDERDWWRDYALEIEERHAPPPSAWQPIETAPRGETILVAYDSGRVYLALDHENDYDWEPYDGVRQPNIQKPTHWMPVPTPPTKCEDQS